MTALARSLCRSCQAPVIWGLTRLGKRCPYDADPAPDGTNAIVSFTEGTPVFSSQIPLGHEDPDRYVSHFTTCTTPEKWSKGKR